MIKSDILQYFMVYVLDEQISIKIEKEITRVPSQIQFVDRGALWGLIKYSKGSSWNARPNHRSRQCDFLT